MTQSTPQRVLPAPLNLIVLSYTGSEAWTDGDGELETWHVSADVMNPGFEQAASHIGDFKFAVADPFKTRGLWWTLDDLNADGTEMAIAMVDQDTNDFHDDLLDVAQGPGEGMLILSRARLTEEWRGFGVGATLVGKSIRRLGNGCRGVACYPMPLSQRDHELTAKERTRGTAALARTWAGLGFKPYRNGVMVLDLGLQLAEDKLNERIRAAEALPQPQINPSTF